MTLPRSRQLGYRNASSDATEATITIGRGGSALSGPAVRISENPRLDRIAVWMIALHLGLLTAFGRLYAKITVLGSLNVYVTELVLVLVTLVSVPSLISVRMPKSALLVSLTMAIAVGWSAGGVDEAGMKWLSFFVYGLFFFVVVATARHFKNRERIIRAILTGTQVGAIAALVRMMSDNVGFIAQMLPVDPILTTTDSTRWLPGEFGLYGIFAIVISGSQLLRGAPATWNRLGALCAGTIDILLSQQRTAVVAIAVAGATVLLFSARVAQHGRKRAACVLVGALLVPLIGFALVDPTYLYQSSARVWSIADRDDVNSVWRLENWAEVMAAVEQKPLGHGFHDFRMSFNTQDSLVGSHNSFVDLLYRIGLPGGALLLTCLCIVGFGAVRTATIETDSASHALPMVGCLVATCVYAAFNMVFESPYCSVFFWVFLGVAATCNLVSSSSRVAKLPRLRMVLPV